MGKQQLGKQWIVGLLVMGLLAPAGAFAHDDDKQHRRKHHKRHGGYEHRWDKKERRADYRNDAMDFRFSATQRRLLDDLFRFRSYERRRDLLSDSVWRTIAMQSALPPGIQKQVARGKPLPPGIAKKMVTLPYGVNTYAGLPYGNRARLGVLNQDVILYDVASGLVYDILRNFIR